MICSRNKQMPHRMGENGKPQTPPGLVICLGSQGSLGLLFWARFIPVACIFETYHFILTKCVMLGNPHFWDMAPTHPLGALTTLSRTRRSKMGKEDGERHFASLKRVSVGAELHTQVTL